MDGKQAAIVVRLERVDLHPGSTDGDVVPDSIIIGNLRRINTRQHKQIREHCETIGGPRATISELEERDALKTTAIDELQKTIEEIKSKNEKTQHIDEDVIEAVWPACQSQEDAVEVMQQKETIDAKIDEKSVFKRLNRILDGRRADVRDRDKIIESLRVDVADRDRHIDESGAVIAKLRIERNRLTHNLYDANDKLNSVVDVLDELKRGRLHTHKANEEIGKLVREDKP